MKRFLLPFVALFAGISLLAGCSSASTSLPVAESSTPESSAVEEETTSLPEETDVPDISESAAVTLGIYRGRVVAIDDDGIEVEQLLPGFDYGYERIRFVVEADMVEEGGIPLQEDAYVEVQFDGALTRSLIPQGVADAITVLAPYSDGILINGVIVDVTEDGDSYTLTVNRYTDGSETAVDEEDEDKPNQQDELEEPSFVIDENMVILHVPADALQMIDAGQLVAGTDISAISTGIAAMSMPPQYPIYALLPYTG